MSSSSHGSVLKTAGSNQPAGASRHECVSSETARLEALRSLRILHTAPEEHYDTVCELAHRLFNVSTVLICFVEEDHQWFKATYNFDESAAPKDVNFCREAIASDDVFVIEDASKDPRFATNPYVHGPRHVRFYAAAPLILKPGVRVGVIALLDREPRAFSPDERRLLERQAAVVMAHLRLHEANVRQKDELAAACERERELQFQARDLAETNRVLNLAEELAYAGHWRLEWPSFRRSWSPGTYRIFGLDPVQAVPDLADSQSGYHPEDRDHILAMIQNSVANRTGFSLATRVVRPSGEIRDVEVRGEVECEGGDVSGVFGVIIDYTDRKKVQMQLSESLSRFDILASGAKEYALYTLDASGHITSWNAGAQSVKGYAAEEIIGRHCSMFYPQSERDEGIPARALKTAREHGRFEAEGWRLRRDGTRFWAHVIIDAIHDSENNLAGYAKITRDLTGVREFQQRLEAGRARYQLLADNATDMIVQIDNEGNRIFVSPACFELSGYTPDEMLSLRPSDTIHPDDAWKLEDLAGRLRRGEQDHDSITNRFRRKNGTYVWVEARWRVIRDERGEKIGFIAAVRDISATQKAEEALRRSESLYRTLAESLPQMVWIMRGYERRSIYANRQFYDFAGQSDAVPDAQRDRIHPDDLRRWKHVWDAALKAKAGYNIEIRLRRHDGPYRWHKCVVLCLGEESGEIEWLGTALDVEDIIAGRQALEDTSQLLTLAQEAAGAGTFDIDLLTRRAVLSRESAVMHGLDGREPYSLTLDEWLTCIDPEDGALALKLVGEACARRTTYSAEFRVTRGNQVRWIHGTGRAQYDASGKAYRMVGLNFDITERKNAETLLIQARAEAEAASAAKTEFLASMSHEIRTPLNSILGYADLVLDEEDLLPSVRRKLSLIQQSGSALLTVVNDILDFSKIEAGQVELDHDVFQVGGLVDSVVSILSHSAVSKGLWLRHAIAPNVPLHVSGDMNRLRQILLNLTNNAIKFTHEGGVVLEVKVAGVSQGETSLHFTVRDTGIGIPVDRQTRLFQRFQQGDNSITRRFGGTGLGLAICKELVELMGGQIGVKSQEGEGAAFWFTLRLPVVAASEPVMTEVGDDDMPPRRAAKLLLVEDVDINRALACAILEVQGHEVDVACSGVEAIQKLKTNRYDIILMDIQMPDMDGITATRHIRSMEHHARNIPIVAMTANVLPQQIATFKAAGMNDHVGKPFNRNQLFNAINRLLEEKRGPRSIVIDKPSFIDREIMDELKKTVGESTFDNLILRFQNDLYGRFGSPAAPLNADQLRADAHIVTSTAGMLGFTDLAKLCRDTELACLDGQDPANHGRQLQILKNRALDEIAAISRKDEFRDHGGRAG